MYTLSVLGSNVTQITNYCNKTAFTFSQVEKPAQKQQIIEGKGHTKFLLARSSTIAVSSSGNTEVISLYFI